MNPSFSLFSMPLLISNKLTPADVDLFYQIQQEIKQACLAPTFELLKKKYATFRTDDNFSDWLNNIILERFCVKDDRKLFWPICCYAFVDPRHPKDRMNFNQHQEIQNFVQKNPNLQSTKGRYGFAELVRENGPLFLKVLPFGYTVELVQLLLNRADLLFDKGTVSVNTNTLKDFNPDATLEYFSTCSTRIGFHYEKTGFQHDPDWTGVLNVDLCQWEKKNLNDEKKGIYTKRAKNMFKIKTWTSDVVKKKTIAKAAAIKNGIKLHYWRIAFNKCLKEIRHSTCSVISYIYDPVFCLDGLLADSGVSPVVYDIHFNFRSGKWKCFVDFLKHGRMSSFPQDSKKNAKNMVAMKCLSYL